MFGIILIIIGIAVGMASGVFRTVPNQKRVYGKVIDVEEKKTAAKGRSLYKAHVEYRVRGYLYTVKSQFGSRKFKVGQRIIVAYNKHLPREAFVCVVTAGSFVMLGLILVGVVCLLCKL